MGSVKHLGVHIDRELNFNGHVTTICKIASRQLNALGRLANVLSVHDKAFYLSVSIYHIFHFFPAVYHCYSLADIQKLKVFRSELFVIFIMTMFLVMPNYLEKVINYYCMLTD